MKTKRGISKKPAFLAAFITCANVTKAAAATNVERTLVYRWAQEDAEFAKAFEEAKILAAQTLEDEAVRRAHEGIDEPVIYQGQLCYALDQYEKDANGKPKLKRNAKPLVMRKYSDGLLQFLLGGFMPEKYRKRNLEVTGKDGGPIKLENNNLRNLSDEELQSLVAIAQKLTPENEPK